MQDLSEIVQIKEAAEADLLSRPGVTGVDVGYKYVGGQKTDQIAIRVHVAEKKDVPPDQAIPDTIDGVITDVLQNTFVPQVLAVPEAELPPQVDPKTYNPLEGGISIGPCRSINGMLYIGTLGAMVLDNTTSTPMMLSNFHVMCVDNGWQVGDPITQPSRVNGGLCPNNTAGTLQRASLGGQVDCAVATLVTRGSSSSIVDIGPVAEPAAAVLGMAVRKRGYRTLLTSGIVDGIAMTLIIDYGNPLGRVTLTNQIVVQPDLTRNPKFSQPGDSGSVVVNTAQQVIGLLCAGAFDGTITVVNPIQAVLDAMNISLRPPFSTRTVEVGTAFAPEMDGVWQMADYYHEDVLDLVFIKTSNTNTGTVEIHIASGVSSYQTRILDTGTTFAPETDGVWQMADYSHSGNLDLIFIKTSNTNTNTVEVHVAPEAYNYQRRTVETGTMFALGMDGVWQMADYDHDGILDLVFMKTGNTLSGMVEIYVASGVSNYQTQIVGTPTTFALETDGTWQVADYDHDGTPDLVFIKTSNTNTGTVEVHVASGASNYQTRILDTGTAFAPETDGRWQVADYDYDDIPDLIFIKTSNTNTGTVEVHVAV